MPRRRRPPRPGALADLSPLRILTQIAILQACYYAVALVLIFFTTFVAGQHPNAGLLLDWHNVRGDVTTGWTLALCWGLDALMMYVDASETENKPCRTDRLLTMPPQGHPHSPPNRPLQTRPGLRYHDPHPSPPDYLPLHPRHPLERLLVVRASLFRCPHDWLGNVGLPVARAETDGLWWEQSRRRRKGYGTGDITGSAA